MGNFGSGRRSKSFNRDRDDSDRGSRFGGRSENRGSRGGFRDRDSRKPFGMHDATCSKCGKNCQVPFKPTGSKPVLCSSCFRQGGSNRDSRDSGRDSRNFDRPSQYQSGNSSEQFNQINAKLDKIIQILQDLEMSDDSEEEDDENSEE